ncbi:MAG TPA: hypothetical protein VL128_14315 [Candidatus Eisenbacteria bacterium]|nr:hypothetical protein [Candidatus Eisenbacteria bacterium]
MKCLVSIALFLTAAAPSAFAQHNCPQGFQYAGTLSGTGGYEEFNERVELLLPEGATIDTTYQQPSVRSRDGNKAAKSDLRAANIPKGIHIIPHGLTDYQKGWAVSAPKLEQVQGRYKFGMKLYCTTGGGTVANMGGCAVDVEVCYMVKK